MSRCICCVNYDSREGYCPVRDRDVIVLTHACEDFRHYRTLFDNEDDEQL